MIGRSPSSAQAIQPLRPLWFVPGRALSSALWTALRMNKQKTLRRLDKLEQLYYEESTITQREIVRGDYKA
ncbi:MAG TPA: hypothetical protein VK395_03880 [Gemmataceae bacterium]|nr:hypothetical protein [Gemmataceae bacterium]